jgi:DNA helicase HerA-like ATPase
VDFNVGIERQLDNFRAARREIEASVLPLATSGSGKTYSLGVILERLLIETDLRVVVLDPNSDFVRLGQVRSDADPVLAERYRRQAGEVAVYSAHAGGERRLRLHAAEVEPAVQAAALRLDPIADRDEYAALAEFLASSAPGSARRAAPTCRPPGHPRGDDQTYSRRRIQVRVRKPQIGGR